MLLLSLERERINFKGKLKFYLLTILFIILQSSVFVKYISFLDFTPNLLLILLVVYGLNLTFLDSLKFAVFIGIFKDLLNPYYILLDLPLYVLYILIIFFVKSRIVSSNQFVRTFLAFFIFSVDFSLKSLIFYIKTRQFELDKYIFLYVILNISIFFILDKFLSKKKETNEF